MTFQDNLNAAQSSTQQDNIMNSFIKYYIDNELNLLKNLILGGAPEALDTLKELADAISSDPDFFQSMADSNAALQTAIDAVQADVDQNESDSDAAIAAETSARTTAVANEASTRQAAIDAVNVLITTLQTEAAARLVRIEALEADPTTQTLLDAEATARDNADNALDARLDVLEADPTTQTLLDAEQTAREGADAALSGRLDVLEADPTTETALAVERGRIDAILSGADADKDTFAEIVTLINSVDTTNDNAFAAYVLSNDAAVAAVQSDVDQNESDGDAADAALSGRLDTLEADPTTQTAVDAKLNIASPAATGTLTVDTNASLKFDSNLTKVENVLRSTSIEIGNNITLKPAAADGRVEVEGEFYLRPSDLTNAADDTAAAAAGIIVGQVYRNGSQLMVRVS